MTAVGVVMVVMVVSCVMVIVGVLIEEGSGVVV